MVSSSAVVVAATNLIVGGSSTGDPITTISKHEMSMVYGACCIEVCAHDRSTVITQI